MIQNSDEEEADLRMQSTGHSELCTDEFSKIVLNEKTLPNEMWEEIMSRMDLFDLIKLRRISRKWLEMVDGVIKREAKWYEKCRKDVTREYWTSILEHQNHPELSTVDFDKSKFRTRVWYSIYESWKSWTNLIDKKITRQTTIDTPGWIMMNNLYATGNIIVVINHTSLSNNTVIVYDIEQLNKDPLYVMNEDRQTVVGVHACRKDNDLMVVTSGRRDVQYLNVVPLLRDNSMINQNNRIIGARSKIIRTEDDDDDDEYYSIHRNNDSNSEVLVSTSLGYCYTLKATFILNATGEIDRACVLLCIKSLSREIDCRIVRLKKQDAFRQYVAIGADGAKVILLSIDPSDNCLLMHQLSSNSSELLQLSKIHTVHSRYVFYQIFKPCVLTCLNGQYDFGISVAGRELKFYNIEEDLGLKFRVTTIFYHVGLLILGSDSGEICLIEVKNVDDLETLKRETLRHRIVKLESCNDEEVSSLAVTEHNTNPYIIVGTTNRLHLIEFH